MQSRKRGGAYLRKLTDEQVAAMIAEAIPTNGANFRALAAKYGIHEVTAYYILLGRTHVKVPRPNGWRMPSGFYPEEAQS